MTEGEQPLKPKGLPNNPTGLLRCQYKYSKDNKDYYILADFEIKYKDDTDEFGVSYANWSKYRYIDKQINEDNEPIISTTTTCEEFHEMILSEGWQREGHEFVICR
jgi:hypothetical protein